MPRQKSQHPLVGPIPIYLTGKHLRNLQKKGEVSTHVRSIIETEEKRKEIEERRKSIVTEIVKKRFEFAGMPDEFNKQIESENEMKSQHVEINRLEKLLGKNQTIFEEPDLITDFLLDEHERLLDIYST